MITHFVATAIHLVREGGDVVVKLEMGDHWVEVIREHAEGPFSHICEAAGVADRFKRSLEEGRKT